MIEQFVISEQFIDVHGNVWESNDTWEGEADISGFERHRPCIDRITVTAYQYVNGSPVRHSVDVHQFSPLWTKVAAHLEADTSLQHRFDEWDHGQPSIERNTYADEHRLRQHEVL